MRSTISRGIAWNAQRWAMVNICLTNVLMRIKWDVRMNAEIDPGNQYLVCANHQSWNDIMLLMGAFGRKAPFFKFFLKRELIRSEEHTSELQSLMRIPYAVFCLKRKNNTHINNDTTIV